MTSQDVPRRVGRRVLAAALMFASVGAPTFVRAQDGAPTLAEIARQEVERRKTIKAPGKVYTDKGTRTGTPVPAAPVTATPANTPGSEARPAATPVASDVPVSAAKTDAAADTKGETFWRARINEARENLRRNEVFAEALQSRVNGLTTDFSARDDPFQRAKIGEERQKALVEQQRVKDEIETSRKLIATIEEEARKAGAPPGWLR
jgi:hypothetical protein